MRILVVGLVACSSTPAPARPVTPVAPFALEGEAELVGDGVSTAYSEIRIAATDALRIWGSTDRPGGPGGWDLWLSRKTAAGWSEPTPAPFDSPANDFDPAISPDGRYVYFFSNRAGGAGGDDIYRAPITGAAFGDVEHLGPEINTAGNEWAPSPTPDGLLFATNRTPGKHDLYFAPTGGAAAPLRGAINTPDQDEFDATYLADGSTIVFARSADVENDPIELFVSHRAADGTYDAGTRLANTVNVDGGYTLGPSIDRDVLYFSSKRAAPSAGKLDIYRIRYH